MRVIVSHAANPLDARRFELVMKRKRVRPQTKTYRRFDVNREVAMRRLALLLSLISFVLLYSRVNEISAQYSSSQIFTETGYDFQGIPRYTMPKHSFIFTNNSSEDLRLIAVRTSCQCTKVYIPEKRVYKQGEKGELVAQIDAVRFTGARHATVTTTFERGGRTFEVALNVVGMVLENVRVEPSQLSFVVDELKGSEAASRAKGTRTQQAVVTYPSNETVVRYTCSTPYIDVKIGQPRRASAGVQTPIFVTIKDDAPAGYISDVVHLWSNGAYSSSPLTLNVSGSVRAQLSVSPSTLTFFTSKDGEKITKNIVITASKEFTLKKIDSDSRAIGCNIPTKSIRPARVCVIPITFDPSKLQAGSTRTRVRIETADGQVLYLSTQISEGNFAELGLKVTDDEIKEGDALETPTASGSAVADKGTQQVLEGGIDATTTRASGKVVSQIPQTSMRTTRQPTPQQGNTYNRRPQARPRQEGSPIILPFQPFGGIFQ